MTWEIDLLVNVILEFRWLRPLANVSWSTAEHTKKGTENQTFHAARFEKLYLPCLERCPDEVQDLSQVKDHEETTQAK